MKEEHATTRPELRNSLEKRIVEARDASEAAARNALEALAVREAKPYPSLSEDERQLRNLLRAKARVLGARPESDGGLDALVEELAYVRWHRFLFARFLVENGLLVHPEYGVSVSMADCDELAHEEGDADGWMTASRYAQKMLPEVFPADDPLLSVRFFPEGRRAMISAMEGIPKPTFSSDDGLGWTYQFWQTKAKKEVNASGRKIGGKDLPAVTQLFTEDYMVEFLLHNSLGAWWAARHPESRLIESFSYLRWREPEGEVHREPEREVEGGAGIEGGDGDGVGGGRGAGVRASEASASGVSDGTPASEIPAGVRGSGTPDGVFADGEVRARTPAAGTFDGWLDTAAKVTVLDPCCGSGHFLVAAAAMLARMRGEEEGFSPADAAEAVLRDNVFGLELDGRCAQIAAFSLALWAWREGGHRPIPAPHVAWSGSPAGGSSDEWAALARGENDLENTLRRLHKLFEDAPDLGSLIDPSRVAEGRSFAKEGTTMLGFASVEKVEEMLDTALSNGASSIGASSNGVSSGGADDGSAVFAGAASGIARAVTIMREKYTLVATNVPYLARGRMVEKRLRNRRWQHSMAAVPEIGRASVVSFLFAEPRSLYSCSGRERV
ncbi:MAG: hypothetical protein H0U65_02985, partial [Rubrobacter sp.]|nr:hypothetical protein [Rubrobacter sp.]